MVTGPTASGKSKLALEIAQDFSAEIICADSRSVYKDFDIVSAKPTLEEQKQARHHLLDVVTPGEDFSADNFKTLALNVIEDIFLRGGQPVICGGTWFYITSLLGFVNLSKVPPNKDLRVKLEKKSSLVLFDMLLELNEPRAREIEPNNRERVIRAIEIACANRCEGVGRNGRSMDSTTRATRAESFQEQLIGKYDVEFIIKEMDRKELYARIDARVDAMIKMGLEAEYMRNKEKYGNLEIFGATIGYGEFEKYPTRTATIEKIKQNTRNFAKRQLTWFNSLKRSTPSGLTVRHVRTNME